VRHVRKNSWCWLASAAGRRGIFFLRVVAHQQRWRLAHARGLRGGIWLWRVLATNDMAGSSTRLGLASNGESGISACTHTACA